MKKFIITYAFTGGTTIEAETEQEAREKFETISEFNLYEDSAPVEVTNIFEESD